jgi:hypothetical protein
VRGRTVAGQLNQVDARAAVQEARADHGSSRIASADVGKQFFRISGESGYSWPDVRELWRQSWSGTPWRRW